MPITDWQRNSEPIRTLSHRLDLSLSNMQIVTALI